MDTNSPQTKEPYAHWTTYAQFYGVSSPEQVIAAQAAHIEKLQKKLDAMPLHMQHAIRRVREG